LASASEIEELKNESPIDTKSDLPQITIESPVPDVESSESEAEEENSPSIEHSESEQSKSSSSSSQSESENEAEDKYESANRSPTSKPVSPVTPVSPDNKAIEEPVVKSLETENLTNGDTRETPANFETGISVSEIVENLKESEEASSDSSDSEASNSSDDEAGVVANEGETGGTEIEKVQSYAQLVTPAGFAVSAVEEVANEGGYGGGNYGGYGNDGGYGGGNDGGNDGGDCG